jgi:DMSO/TMAO reductase YedYZ molybdopterin-dependent catalytic subunit
MSVLEKIDGVRATWPAATAGLLTAAISLGIAELVAGMLLVRSPVIAVGDGVIDVVPHEVKDFAIETFGTNDKLALLAGIYSLLVVFAIVVGLIARRNLLAGIAALSVFGIVGVVAGLNTTDPRQVVVAPVIGVIAGAAALTLLQRRMHAATKSDHDTEGASAGFDRRAFLVLSGKVAVVAAVATAGGRWLGSRLSAAASRAAVVLPQPFKRLSPVPPGASVSVDGVTPFVTPNASFYRIDTALAVPQVTTDTWVLRIKGMVQDEVEISFDDLLSRPMVESDITLTCVSNVVGGELAGNARWLGVPLRELLDEAGVDPQKATQVVGRSVDGYACGFPTIAAYDGRDALVAVGMNGEPLPIEHGFPARLVVAGLYGYVSATKWLKEIELTTLEDFDSYWVRRSWAKEAPIKTQSRIDVPRGFAKLPAGRNVVAGVAWAQTRGVQTVEVRIDEGPWQRARLGVEVSKSTWRQWVHEWDAEPGSHRIFVRATDGTGEVQTSKRADPIPDGATGWHSVLVTVGS